MSKWSLSFIILTVAAWKPKTDWMSYQLLFIMLFSMIVDPIYLILQKCQNIYKTNITKTSLILRIVWKSKILWKVPAVTHKYNHTSVSHLFLFPDLRWLTFSATFSTPFLRSWAMSLISRALLLLKLLKSCWWAMLWCSWYRGSLQAISSLRITSINSSRWHTRVKSHRYAGTVVLICRKLYIIY